ncbi:hypothetical protein D3C75_969700 [compost metagenome]
MTANGLRPRLSASERRISTSAAAPSEIELALAAVTVPPSRNAGLSCAILSRRALGGCSSSLMTRFSLPSVTSTGTISAAKRPLLIASCARVSEAMANWSWASRLKALAWAQSSAKVPIRRPLS